MREGSPILAMVTLRVYGAFALFELRGRSLWELKMREGPPNLAEWSRVKWELRGRSVWEPKMQEGSPILALVVCILIAGPHGGGPNLMISERFHTFALS